MTVPDFRSRSVPVFVALAMLLSFASAVDAAEDDIAVPAAAVNWAATGPMPARGIWITTGAMIDARVAHSATLLPNGTVLVTGGSGFGGAHISTELWGIAP